ncbi:AI-2E family transporter [Methylobacterium oryzisoli]|uniref:AI-2E family transporter n=1 Tax=Methylobacterium oryzisoli TaxID=3385502 RepID=UPI0038919961
MICALILGGAALSVARPVFAPVAFALFVIAIVWPFQRRLQAVLPKILALAVSIVVTTLVVMLFGSLISWGISRVVRAVMNDAARLQTLYAQMADWLENHGIILAGLWAEHFNIRWLIRLLPEVTNRINSTATFLFVVLIYVILGLLEVDEAARKLGATGRWPAGHVLLLGGAKTAAKLRRFMLVRTLMSAMTGVLVWAFAAFAGLDLAPEWGVIAFAFNYIPVIGPLVATVLPTLYAMAQFASWEMGLTLFLGLNLIQFLVGSYLEPRVAGSALSLSPFMILFSVFFWTFLWGIAGAFIGVPIMIAIVTMCEQHPASRWVADLLGSGAERAPP